LDYFAGFMRYTIFVGLLIFSSTVGFAQLGGKRSFEFLNVPNNARLAGLGGLNVSLADRDINFTASNPALLGDTLAGFASASYQFYVADVGQASATYAHNFKKLGLLAFGVQHLNYGEIKSYDASGTELGDFKSGETALFVSRSHQISNFRLGGTIRMAFSSIAGYRASALMFDIGGLFVHPRHDFTVGLVIKNAGFILSRYATTGTAPLPFDVRLGTSIKPEHMPVRFSLTVYNLANEYGSYFNSASQAEEPRLANKILRHANLAAEVLIHKNVNLLLGYNFLVHQELKLENSGGIAGISFGFSAQIRSFQFVFSRSAYVVGNAGYGFTLSKNIENNFISRR
jgi:hypothetical protein